MKPVIQGGSIILIIFCLVVLAVLATNLLFPATWSCKYNHSDNLCWCGWDNRPTQEYGFNYTEKNCNEIGRVVK